MMDALEFDKLIRGKNINFLIGSGASFPMYPTLSFGDDYPSFEEVVSNSGISTAAKIGMYIYYFINWIEPMGLGHEEFLKKYQDNDAIKNTIKNYGSFIKILYNYLQCESNELPKRINIFTTNYDLVFERTFDDFLKDNPLIYFNDGSRGVFKKYISNSNFYLNITHSGYNDNYKREVPTINLFKLHGSLSWSIEQDKIIVEENNREITPIREFLKKIGITLKKIENIVNKSKSRSIDNFVRQLNTEIRQLKLNKKQQNKFFLKYKNLLIINPDKYKFFATVSEQHYYQLIRSFSYELERKQSVLIVFGFSFSDEHLKEIFERSLLNPELQVIIISYSQNEQRRIKTMFSGYKNIIFLPEDNGKGNFLFLLSLLGETNEQ